MFTRRDNTHLRLLNLHIAFSGQVSKLVLVVGSSSVTVGDSVFVTVEAQNSASQRVSISASVNLVTNGSAVPSQTTVFLNQGTAQTVISNFKAESVTLRLENPSITGIDVTSTRTVIFSPSEFLKHSDLQTNKVAFTRTYFCTYPPTHTYTLTYTKHTHT